MLLEEDSIERALETLGSLLEERGFESEIVVVGGSALLLLGIIHRPTKDLDVLALVNRGEYQSAQPLPDNLRQAASDVAEEFGLAPDWLNSGPTAQLLTGLPEGFHNRVETRIYSTLIVHIASRVDQICLKLHAAVDQWPSKGKHVSDLGHLAPTRLELLEAARWVLGQDAGPNFPTLVSATLKYFGVEDAEAPP